LAVGGGGIYRLVDTQGAVDDGKFGVGTQMYESHAGDFREQHGRKKPLSKMRQ
jgi:hypothetical protein